MQPTPRIIAAALIGLFAAAAFGYLLKLMHDMAQSMQYMTRDIASMASDMHQMRNDLSQLTQQVGGMRGDVNAMAHDVRGMRHGVERMAGVIQTGGKQLEQINPMGVIQQIIPGGQGR